MAASSTAVCCTRCLAAQGGDDDVSNVPSVSNARTSTSHERRLEKRSGASSCAISCVHSDHVDTDAATQLPNCSILLPRSHLLGLLCCWEAGSVRPARVEEPIDEARTHLDSYPTPSRLCTPSPWTRAASRQTSQPLRFRNQVPPPARYVICTRARAPAQQSELLLLQLARCHYKKRQPSRHSTCQQVSNVSGTRFW